MLCGEKVKGVLVSAFLKGQPGKKWLGSSHVQLDIVHRKHTQHTHTHTQSAGSHDSVSLCHSLLGTGWVNFSPHLHLIYIWQIHKMWFQFIFCSFFSFLLFPFLLLLSPQISHHKEAILPLCSSVSLSTMWSLMHLLALTMSHSKQDLIITEALSLPCNLFERQHACS